MICIVDYQMGNLFSVHKRIRQLGYESTISKEPRDITNASKLILPGVGHFGMAMEQLEKHGLCQLLDDEVLNKRKPILGICLGMQLLTKFSHEGDAGGLGWLDAEVKRFEIQDTVANKVPHTGWNQIFATKPSRLLNGIPDGSEFYFVHSYYVKLNRSEEQLTYSEFERPFTSAIEKDNIFGVQFHPEKSHDVGSQMLKNFVEL